MMSTDLSLLAKATPGKLVYAPRIDKKINSRNPALIFADMLSCRMIIVQDFDIKTEEFWVRIGLLADCADELFPMLKKDD